MIPAWKVKRELKRVWYQIVDLPDRLFSIPDRLAHKRRLAAHDRDFSSLVRVREGRITPNDKYVVFLIYQPEGIPASVFLTLNYLVRSGYAPLVVMNSPLLPDDTEKLLECSWKVATRPNFGYDFGGYRDGLRLLCDDVKSLHRLIIMNDSVWFPMQGDPIPMLEARLDEGDFDAVGLNQDQKVRYHKDGSYHYELRHLESYFFLISDTCFSSEPFRRFWNEYRMSSNKRYTIKHGEIGFSKYMMRQGARFDGLLKRSHFVEAIAGCDVDFLRTTLEYAAYADDNYKQERDYLISRFSSGEAWRQEALGHIRNNALRRPFTTSFCYAADGLFGTVYLKKNSQTYFHDMRQQYFRAVNDGLVPAPAPEILYELTALINAHDPETAERTL